MTGQVDVLGLVADQADQAGPAAVFASLAAVVSSPTALMATTLSAYLIRAVGGDPDAGRILLCGLGDWLAEHSVISSGQVNVHNLDQWAATRERWFLVDALTAYSRALAAGYTPPPPPPLPASPAPVAACALTWELIAREIAGGDLAAVAAERYGPVGANPR